MNFGGLCKNIFKSKRFTFYSVLTRLLRHILQTKIINYFIFHPMMVINGVSKAISSCKLQYKGELGDDFYLQVVKNLNGVSLTCMH